MANYKIQTNVRPWKIGFLVPADCLDSYDKAVQYACSRWGGLHDLIIPVNGDDSSISQPFIDMVVTSPPDTWVSFLEPELNLHTGALHQFLSRLLPNRSTTIHDGNRFGTYDQGMHILSTIPAIAREPEASLQKASLRVFSFTGDSDSERVLLTILGKIPPEQREEYEKAFDFETSDIELGSRQVLPLQLQSDHESSPINMTTKRIATRKVVNHFAKLAFTVVVVDSQSDLCKFWNLRAIRDAAKFGEEVRRTILFPRPWLRSHRVEWLLELVRKQPAIPGCSCNVDLIWVVSRDEIAQEVEECMVQNDCYREEKGVSTNRWSGNTDKVPRESDSDRQLRYTLGPLIVPASYEAGLKNSRLPTAYSSQLTNCEIQVSLDEEFTNRFMQGAVLDLCCDELWKRFPRSSTLASNVWKGAWFSTYGLSNFVSPRGSEFLVRINFPTDWDALRMYFESQKLGIRLSDKGRYAQSFLKLLGGTNKIELLADKKVFRILDSLAMKSSKKVAQRLIRELGLRETSEQDLASKLLDVEVVSELKRVPKTLEKMKSLTRMPKTDILRSLAPLIELQLVKRGFLFNCPNCAVPDWYPLSALSDALSCRGCSFSFSIPAEYPERSGLEPNWEYTLNTLLNRSMDQDVMPVLLSIYFSAQKQAVSCLAPGLEVIRNGEECPFVEFDFVFVRGGQLIAGECKSGTELSQKDIDSAKIAGQIGIAEFWFCSASTFSDEANRQIETLKEELAEHDDQIFIGVANEKELFGSNL